MAFTPNAVLEYIQKNGPQVPNAIRQALGAQDNFVVGAVLSELLASRDLAMTDLAYGTSKFYYDPKHPDSLEPLGKYLNEKDNRAFELLKTERVARHSALSPLNRVAMAQIKDFSRPLKLMTPDGEEIFWRYYLVSEEEAMDLIEAKFFGHLKPASAPAPSVPTTTSSPPTPVQHHPEPRAPASEPSSIPAATSVSTSQTKPKRKSPAKKSTKATVPSTQVTLDGATTQPKAPELSRAPVAAGEFSSRIAQYFAAKDIKLVEDLGSTKSELTAIVAVPSAIGEMRYYCKAKVKKITGDGDIAPAFIEAQQRGLPLLYVAAGTLTRKAQELVPTLKGTVVMTPWTHGN